MGRILLSLVGACAAGVVVVAMTATGLHAQSNEPHALSTDQLAELVEKSSLTMDDHYLRDAMAEMLDMLIRYSRADEAGIESVGGQLCQVSRGLYFFYERYQNRYGLEASLQIRGEIRELFRAAEVGLAQASQEHPDLQLLAAAHSSVKRKFVTLQSRDPIPPARILLAKLRKTSPVPG